MQLSKTILFSGLLMLISLPSFGQFRSLMRKANKQYELKAFNLAAETYREALERRADDPEALGNLADCYRHMNQMQEAAKHYVRAVAQKEFNPRYTLELGHVFKALGDYDNAKRWYLEYAKDNPTIGNHYAQTCDFAKRQQPITGQVTVKNELVNSPASDFGPAFYRGQVVFSSARIDIQRSSTDWTGQAQNQLYIASQGADGLLQNPVFLKNRTTTGDFNEGPVSFSPDGRYVAYTKNNFVDGTRQIPSSGMLVNLYIAEVTSNGDWVNAQPFPYNGSEFSTGYPCFTADGNALYFASDRPQGFGGFDIYISTRNGATWGRPENLGAVINSPGNELSPYFHENNLFFSSDWHPGLGGFDIFRAELLGDSWSQIFHIGAPVSSSYDDYGFIYNSFQNIGYFTSNRPEGKGNEDLYFLSRASENIILNIVNASDGTPISNAVIDFTSCGRGLQQADERGIYRLQIVDGMNCNVTVRKDGYIDQVLPVQATGQQGSRNMNISLVRRGEEYFGKVLNYQTRTPVPGVIITATNQLTGSSAEQYSDQNGDFTLAMSPNSTYVLRFSAPGFRDINKTVRSGDGSDRSILGTINILPANAPIPGGFNDPTLETTQPAGPVTTVESGYAVQVAAMSKPSLDGFRDLLQFGQIYSKEENGMHKVRVGVFATRSEAQQALAQIKRKGYSKAFLVEDSGHAIVGKGTASNPTGASTGMYKIQLGAYSNPRNFNDSKVRSLGYIEDGKKGNLTVKYLAGFNTLEEARAALPKAQAAGFTSAFIVMEENGKMVRIK